MGIKDRQAGFRARQKQYRKEQMLRPDFVHRDVFVRFRFRMIMLGLLLIVAAILCKLFYIQVIDAQNLKKKAKLSRTSAMTLFSRGRILDRNGNILAQDTVLHDLFAHPHYFFKITRKQIATNLSPFLSTSEQKILEQLDKPYSTILLKKDLSKAEVEHISKARIPVPAVNEKTRQPILDAKGYQIIRHIPVPGLDFSKKTVRNYPQGNLAAHVLGYVNDGADVSSGVESSAAAILKDKPKELSGKFLDGRGNWVDLENVAPEHIVSLPKAKDVRLTLDSRLQYVAERELAKGIASSKAQRGTVIMMDPRTGEILAFAVLPTYQPETFYKAPSEALKNWAITDVYPPGSTFKILTVAAGLESGVINRNTRILDTGKMRVGGWEISNYDYGKHGAPGMIDLVYLLMHSSNIASAKISMMMPSQQHYAMLRKIGMGYKTGIDLPGESAGLVIAPNSWDESTHASIGYGYGMAATPIQVASAVAAIANGGIWNTPHVIKGTPVTHRRIFSRKTCDTMRDLLTASIRDAKTSTVRIEGIEVAGKTGTSKKPNTGRGYSNDLYTSFVGFFPAQSPRVLMMVVVDSPKMAEAWGSTVAGPIFREIAKETISYLGLSTVKMAARDPAQVSATMSGSQMNIFNTSADQAITMTMRKPQQ